MSEEIQERNSARCKYISDVLDRLLEVDPNEYMKNIAARIMLAAKDVCGTTSDAVNFLESVLSTGEPDPSRFKIDLSTDEVSLIDRNEAEHLGSMLAYELLWIHRNDSNYYQEDGLYTFWGLLEASGMSHENIGKYFERFND